MRDTQVLYGCTMAKQAYYHGLEDFNATREEDIERDRRAARQEFKYWLAVMYLEHELDTIDLRMLLGRATFGYLINYLGTNVSNQPAEDCGMNEYGLRHPDDSETDSGTTRQEAYERLMEAQAAHERARGRGMRVQYQKKYATLRKNLSQAVDDAVAVAYADGWSAKEIAEALSIGRPGTGKVLFPDVYKMLKRNGVMTNRDRKKEATDD